MLVCLLHEINVSADPADIAGSGCNDAGEQIPIRYSRSQSLPAFKSRLSLAAFDGNLLFSLAVLASGLRLL